MSESHAEPRRIHANTTFPPLPKGWENTCIEAAKREKAQWIYWHKRHRSEMDYPRFKYIADLTRQVNEGNMPIDRAFDHLAKYDNRTKGDK